ncbi:hypothetical protein G5I_13684 [Acromyrmex echinatior]|uniref:Uncharacterized protein n=1 Tax=Acromyrmex echinatior TaxID=103372 RepID=F4X5P5_ACREC|nr:hypothetical protein G5I_13684 [Acromyrmex echinatior]
MKATALNFVLSTKDVRLRVLLLLNLPGACMKIAIRIKTNTVAISVPLKLRIPPSLGLILRFGWSARQMDAYSIVFFQSQQLNVIEALPKWQLLKSAEEFGSKFNNELRNVFVAIRTNLKMQSNKAFLSQLPMKFRQNQIFTSAPIHRPTYYCVVPTNLKMKKRGNWTEEDMKEAVKQKHFQLLSYIKDLDNKFMPLSRSEFLKFSYDLVGHLKLPHQFNEENKTLLALISVCVAQRANPLALRRDCAVSLMGSEGEGMRATMLPACKPPRFSQIAGSSVRNDPVIAHSIHTEVQKYFRNYHQPHGWLINKNSMMPQISNDTRWNSQKECVRTFVENFHKYNEIRMEQSIDSGIKAKNLLNQLIIVGNSLDLLQSDITSIAKAVEIWMNLIKSSELSNYRDDINNRFQEKSIQEQSISRLNSDQELQAKDCILRA